MRYRLLAAVCLLLPFIAWANPVVVNPSSLVAFGVVAFAAFVVESGLVTLALTFSGLATYRVFAAYFVTNLAVFIFLFSPLLGRLPLIALEALVVVADGAAIKLIASLGPFQQDEFRGVTWLRAGLVALAGNTASFIVGVLAAGAPWQSHGDVYSLPPGS